MIRFKIFQWPPAYSFDGDTWWFFWPAPSRKVGGPGEYTVPDGVRVVQIKPEARA